MSFANKLAIHMNLDRLVAPSAQLNDAPLGKAKHIVQLHLAAAQRDVKRKP
jgi:hypothetical protein